MLYEVPEPYAPPHQLLFMSDADKGLEGTIERYFWCVAHSLCALSHGKLQEQL